MHVSHFYVALTLFPFISESSCPFCLFCFSIYVSITLYVSRSFCFTLCFSLSLRVPFSLFSLQVCFCFYFYNIFLCFWQRTFPLWFSLSLSLYLLCVVLLYKFTLKHALPLPLHCDFLPFALILHTGNLNLSGDAKEKLFFSFKHHKGDNLHEKT